MPMWPFRQKKYSLKDSGLLEGMTDYHCHILPGVDDGVQTLDESVSTFQELGKLGLREFWLTPHIMEEYPNTPDDLKARFGKLCAELEARHCDVTLHLAAEHMLDSLFVSRFATDTVLPIIDGKHLLVETSYFNPPIQLYDILANIQKKGYTPLLAHPERYVYMENRDYHRLRDMGVKLQLNLLSLCGAFGEDAFVKSQKLLNDGAYTVCGTDLHSVDRVLYFASDDCLTSGTVKKLRKVIDG